MHKLCNIKLYAVVVVPTMTYSLGIPDMQMIAPTTMNILYKRTCAHLQRVCSIDVIHMYL